MSGGGLTPSSTMDPKEVNMVTTHLCWRIERMRRALRLLFEEPSGSESDRDRLLTVRRIAQMEGVLVTPPSPLPKKKVAKKMAKKRAFIKGRHPLTGEIGWYPKP